MVFVVERYLPGLSRSDLLCGLSRLAQSHHDGQGVRYLGSTIVLGDEACYCRFEGPTEAAVADTNRRAGLSFDRIVPAVAVETAGAACVPAMDRAGGGSLPCRAQIVHKTERRSR